MLDPKELELAFNKLQTEKNNQTSVNITRSFSAITAIVSLVGTLVFLGISWGFTKGQITNMQKEIVRMENTIATSKDIDNLNTTMKLIGQKYETRFKALEKRLDRIEKSLDTDK